MTSDKIAAFIERLKNPRLRFHGGQGTGEGSMTLVATSSHRLSSLHRFSCCYAESQCDNVGLAPWVAVRKILESYRPALGPRHGPRIKTQGRAMSAKPYRFSASEIRRAIDTVKSTGLRITSVEIGKDGRINVAVNDDGKKPDVQTPQDLRAQL